MNPLSTALRHWLSDISNFSRIVLQRPLRQYQLEPARAILDSVLHGKGLTFAVMMSRQAGKNELSGQLEAYILNLYRRRGGGIVKASPTYKPQTVNSILRLTDRLTNPWNKAQWRRREGYIVELDAARAYFFSAEPSAHVVGATASLLLEGDEAQDIVAKKWDTDFVPMGASTNATQVLWGTAWTSTTFLAQTIAFLEQQQARDGVRRVFRAAADVVGAEVPAYAAFVNAQVQRMGRNHPIIRTQYYLEPIDAEAGMFPPMRQALMHGNHERRHAPEPGHRYALLVDVAGEDEIEGDAMARSMLENKKRDATAVTVVDMAVEFGLQPTFRVVDREIILGAKISAQHGKLLALARHWHALWIVVDATGVGQGLASFLVTALGDAREGGGKVIPFEFSSKTKSELGWDFLAIVETGRYQDYAEDGAPDTRQFWYEVGACQYEISTGPGKGLKWGVWETPAYDGLVARGHDDAVISAALCAVLDRQAWPGTGEASAVIDIPDFLEEIDHATW